MLTALLPMKARSDLLDWDIYTSVYTNDYSGSYPGDELRIDYTVLNNSDSGDAYNLIEFSLSAGFLQGVYNVTKPTGWDFTIGENVTTFFGNYIPPDDSANFSLYSYFTSTAQGTANATSFGGGIPQPFPQLNNITLPSASIPEPTTLSLILAGAGAYILGRRKNSGT